MRELVDRLKAAKLYCPCGGDPLAVRKTCPDYRKCTANEEAASEITRLEAELAISKAENKLVYDQLEASLERAAQAERDKNAAQLADIVSRMADDIATVKTAFETERAKVAKLREALRKLGKTTALLIQNAHGCAVNHYGEDYAVHGKPGWIAGCEADLAAARALEGSHE